jgi:hypothetical protein
MDANKLGVFISKQPVLSMPLYLRCSAVPLYKVASVNYAVPLPDERYAEYGLLTSAFLRNV